MVSKPPSQSTPIEEQIITLLYDAGYQELLGKLLTIWLDFGKHPTEDDLRAVQDALQSEEAMAQFYEQIRQQYDETRSHISA